MPVPIVVSDTSGLAEGIGTAGSAFGRALGQRALYKRQEDERIRKENDTRKHGTTLQQTLGTLSEKASPLQLTQALSSAVAQGVPLEMANQYGTLYSTLQKTNQNKMPGPEQIDTMSNLFAKFGMPPEVAQRNAELWAQLTVGGQTEMAKVLVDQIARNQFLPPNQQMNYGQSGYTSEPIGQNSQQIGQNSGASLEVEELGFGQNSPGGGQITEAVEVEWPEVDVFEDRTPKERVSLKTELLKQNNKEYAERTDSLKSAQKEVMRVDQLSRLNESGKLPERFGRANINWTTGDILVPALATPETQLFVKTINDFTTAAKDTYGATVTNFELGAFMKRLPTLANTSGGRRLIFEQMKAMKDLDMLYNQSIREVYDHYGMQKIDRATAERIAEKRRKPQEEALMKRFENASKAQEVYEAKQLAPEGKIPARGPNGETVYIWRNKADVAQKRGYTPL